MANEEYPFTTFRFDIQLNITNASGLGLSAPLCSMEFAELEGLEMSMEPKTVKEGGNNTGQVNLVGPVTYGNITLKRGMTSNLDIWKWFAAATGSSARQRAADGAITVKDASGRARVRFAIYGCLPLKVRAPALNAKDGQIAIEELQMTVASFTVNQAENQV